MSDAVEREDEREWNGYGEQYLPRAGRTTFTGPMLKSGERVTLVPKSTLLAAEQRAEEAELGDEIAKAEQAYAENRAEKAKSERDALAGALREIADFPMKASPALRWAQELALAALTANPQASKKGT